MSDEKKNLDAPHSIQFTKEFKQWSVSSNQIIKTLIPKVTLFIHRYNQLFDKIHAKHSISLINTAIYSYVFNQDRLYLFPVFNLSSTIKYLADKLPEDEINQLIGSIIKASRREVNVNHDIFLTDMELFYQAQSWVELNKTGYFCIVFSIENGISIHKKDHFHITFNNTDYPAMLIEHGQIIKIKSFPIPLNALFIEAYSRDMGLKLYQFTLSINYKPIVFESLYSMDFSK